MKCFVIPLDALSYTYFVHQSDLGKVLETKKIVEKSIKSLTPPHPLVKKKKILAQNDLVTSCNIGWLDSPPLSLRRKQKHSKIVTRDSFEAKSLVSGEMTPLKVEKNKFVVKCFLGNFECF